MFMKFDGRPIAMGNPRSNEAIPAELRPDRGQQARKPWSLENNRYQFDQRDDVAVKGGTRDFPYLDRKDLVDEQLHPNERSCGFAASVRSHRGEALPTSVTGG